MKLEERMAMMEDRARRSNLRLVFLEEGAESDNPIAFLQRLLPVWLPAPVARGTIEMERAHRVYDDIDTDRKKPRTLIFNMLRYNDRQLIMKAYREGGSSMTHNNRKLLLFADYSAHTN
ncbi:hypothetical protein AAFF_G00275910 [Aldrovandia affinis]|uniref:Uncharacterized protein n=1 Tax=Aldrovandia affinis TaxID=143900 RepID=A0AAD7W1Y3_9TELE|nr:hypothetical protein AAFF_G00275910 [Aldrovandia affinis]